MHPAPPAGGPQPRPRITLEATTFPDPATPVPGILALEDGTLHAGHMAGALRPVVGDRKSVV